MSYNKNEIEFCEWCGCEQFKQHVVDRVEHIECEIEYLCEDCGKVVNYWFYGSFQNEMTPTYLKEKQKRERKLKLDSINNERI